MPVIASPSNGAPSPVMTVSSSAPSVKRGEDGAQRLLGLPPRDELVADEADRVADREAPLRVLASRGLTRTWRSESHLPAGEETLIEPAGRNVVGRDLVAEHGEDARVLDFLDRVRRHRHALEIGRVLDVGRTHVPLVGLGAGAFTLRQFTSPLNTSA